MTLKRVLFPVAIAWAVVNVAGLVWAAVSGEPMHATIHAALAVAFGYGAVRLRHTPERREDVSRIEVLEDEISKLQRELTEKQEGLDFAEQLLAKRPETIRMDPQRFAPKPPESAAIRRDLEEGSEPNRPPE
jgi:hypothetical protein